MLPGGERRRSSAMGIAVVAALILLGLAFLALLVHLTRDRMHPPPPETRDPARVRRIEGR